MNDSMNTSVRKKKGAAQRVAVGAASLLAAGALVGVGAQGAFASTTDHGSGGTGSASWSAPAGHGTGQLGHGLFGSGGQVNGAQAQALAKRVIADKALYDLLPDALQHDLTALAGATAQQRTADAKKVVTTALDGGYGTAIADLAKHLKASAGDRSAKADATGLLDSLRSGDLSGASLGADGAVVASEISADAQLSAKLPQALRTDLATLAAAPSAERTTDVQKIATTAIGGGYGDGIQQLAGQIARQLAGGH
ncbi:hypothetical protein ACFVU2_05710 [Leifsonia sp. NPDC058194]|uniref:hypothetical protein n=1 Tax=Leifsonia sp. NPDC058194 TaxID=3346374 RepID=UPI0036DAFC48